MLVGGEHRSVNLFIWERKEFKSQSGPSESKVGHKFLCHTFSICTSFLLC